MRTAPLALVIVVTASVWPSAQAGMVRLHVVDADSGLPLRRVRVTSAAPETLSPLLTDDQGDTTLAMAETGRSIRFGKAGYISRTVQLSPDDRRVEVPLARGSAISGRVVDALGMPMAGAAVRVVGEGTRPLQRATTTNDLGEYRAFALPEGQYSVTIKKDNTETLPSVVSLRRGQEVGDIDFALPGGGGCGGSRLEQASAVGSSGIRGRVRTPAGEPLACVNIAVFNGGTRVLTAITTADGTYGASLRPGTYTLEFSHEGYVTLQFDQQIAGQPGRPVLLRDREDLRDLDMVLPRSGAISGTLREEDGEPVEGLQVRALQLRGDESRMMGVSMASAVTDDRGRYRLFGLLPGRYIVATAPATDRVDARSGRGYPPVYYPGTAEIAAAATVTLEEGVDAQWNDFTRSQTRVLTVRGTALNQNGKPVTDRVILVASQRSGAVIAETHGADVSADGSFEIPNVPSGDYVVQATSRGGDAAPEFGMAYVTVDDADPLPVAIKTGAGASIRARLIEDSPAAVASSAFAVAAVPVDYDHTSVLAAWQTLAPGTDGLLHAAGLHGPNRITLTSAPDEWYLKSVRWRARDIADQAVDFGVSFGASPELEIVVSNQGAAVEGTANDGISAVDDYSVLLFSTDPSRWYLNSRHLKIGRSNGRGHYRIQGLPEGEYWLAAVDPLDGTPGSRWRDRAALEALALRARRVRLAAGEHRTVALTVVR